MRLIRYAAAAALLATGCANTEYKVQGMTITYEPEDGGAPASAAKSAAKSAGFPEIDIPYQKHILPNGLTLITHEDHKAPLASVNIWYHVGSKDEKPGKTGFAHLFEHVMFQQSEHHRKDFLPALEAAGAEDLNGTTNTDRTNFFETVPTSALDYTLWLESDRMGWLLGAVDQAVLDEQRGVVKNERRQRYENAPYGRVFELISMNTYPAGHPYSWSTIGSMEDLDAASLADVKQWFRDYYGAANVTIVVGGDIDPADVRKKVEHYFGNVPSGPRLVQPQVNIAKMQGEKRAQLEDRVPQTRIYKVWNVPPAGDERETRLEFAAEVLGGGKNSRLYKRLVYKDQIATDAGAFVWEKKLGSQFIVLASVKPGVDPALVERALDEELATFLRDGPDAEELARVKNGLYAGWVRGVERIGGFGGKTDVLAYGDVIIGDTDYFKRYQRTLRESTPQQVRAVARDWLSDGVFVLSVVPTPDFTTAASGADRSRLPALGAAPSLKLPPLERTTLSNGLKVALAQRHAAPVVQMTLLLDAGHVADFGGKRGTATLTFDMLDEGAGRMDALQISAKLEGLGAQLGAGAGSDLGSVTLSAVTANLESSLDVYADVILRPTFPESELARLKPQYGAALQQQKAQAAGLARLIAPGLIYGTAHPYATNGGVGLNSQAELDAIGIADLKAFHQRRFRPDHATLLVVGDVTLDEVKPLLESRLGGWKAPAEPLAAAAIPAAPAPAAPRIFLISKPGAAQSVIWAGAIAPPITDPDNLAMRTLNSALGGMFASRLNLNLREDKHWSYGARSGIGDNRGQRLFAASAPVETAYTADALREMLKEFREVLGKRPLTADEIKLAKDAEVLSLPANNETAPQIAGSYAHILTYGLPDTYFNDLVDKVRGLTPAELAAAAKKLVRPETLTWVVVGDLAKIEAPIRKAGLGEVRVLDETGAVVREVTP